MRNHANLPNRLMAVRDAGLGRGSDRMVPSPRATWTLEVITSQAFGPAGPYRR